MTDYTSALVSSGSDVQAALDAGTALADPHPLDEGMARFYSVVVPAGASHAVVDLEQHLDRYLENPRRKVGAFAAHTGDSFVAYMEKHVTSTSELWADIASGTVTAVINAHDSTAGDAGWGDHRLVLKLQHTPAWTAWTDLDGKWLTQVEFAELLEERFTDVVTPDGATLTEVARTFKATKAAAFESEHILSSGQVQFGYREEISATAGKKGQLDIPERFTLGLAPFEGGKPYSVLARLRFSIDDQKLRIRYVLDRPTEIVRAAFDEVVGVIGAGVDAPLFHGRSA